MGNARSFLERRKAIGRKRDELREGKPWG